MPNVADPRICAASCHSAGLALPRHMICITVSQALVVAPPTRYLNNRTDVASWPDADDETTPKDV
jgi:hypothetical protein